MPKESNKEKVLSALLNTDSITSAAKHCGITERTIYRYLEDAEFKREYRTARREVYENTIGQIQHATKQAVETLNKNLSCGNPSVEVRAAQIILDASTKGIETLDILERLEILEYAAKTES
jgi:methyl coenzyme M reductase gamma subunit